MAAKGKRSELRVTTPKRSFLFEVETPALLAHIEVDWDHPDLQRTADYRPKELVLWY